MVLYWMSAARLENAKTRLVRKRATLNTGYGIDSSHFTNMTSPAIPTSTSANSTEREDGRCHRSQTADASCSNGGPSGWVGRQRENRFHRQTIILPQGAFRTLCSGRPVRSPRYRRDRCTASGFSNRHPTAFHPRLTIQHLHNRRRKHPVPL